MEVRVDKKTFFNRDCLPAREDYAAHENANKPCLRYKIGFLAFAGTPDALARVSHAMDPVFMPTSLAPISKIILLRAWLVSMHNFGVRLDLPGNPQGVGPVAPEGNRRWTHGWNEPLSTVKILRTFLSTDVIELIPACVLLEVSRLALLGKEISCTREPTQDSCAIGRPLLSLATPLTPF